MSVLPVLTAAIAANRRDALRVAVQTIAASAATFLVMSGFGLPHMSWAVISALFTIQLSADSAVRSALGRLAGSLLGVALGLASVALVAGQGAMLVRLAIATGLANAVATVWPSLRYMAVTAAIVTLSQDPELGGALEIAFAILVGSLMGTAAAFLAWPDFGRNRAARALHRALLDCRALLEMAVKEVDGDVRREQDALHARFLGDLEAARSRAAETWFRPKLPSGVRLDDALLASESLWHGLVILDRVVSGERNRLGKTLRRLRPAIREVQHTACEFVGGAAEALQHSHLEPPSPRALEEAVRDARSEALRLGAERGRQRQDEESKGLHALVFALDEVERNLVEIAALSGRVSKQAKS